MPIPKTIRGFFQGLPIPVQGNQLTGPIQPGEDLLGMPPQPQGTIHVNPLFPDLQELQNLIE